MATVSQPKLLTFTEKAAQRIKSLISEDQPGLGLRVFVVSGGCSGFQYGMALDEEREDDFVLEEHGVKVYVDPNSAPYLAGSEIDYIEDIMQSGFSIHNPNAVRSCACGHSFRTADDKGEPAPCTH